MGYVALARKWRPKSFSQWVGQDHIKQALVNALNRGRLHHAYLFSGTRGVGKTSVARLLAKALNCEAGVSSEPCLQCDICNAIDKGQFVDLIEIDAASRTRVEDTREVLDNVQYAPVVGRYKIYLIDEVHMLSGHSFNALLKTLEEPPEHVKFLLATTDPQKLPATILSRCLQFHLNHVDEAIIFDKLQWILEQEQQQFELAALSRLCKAARGSLRDALSLLDQALSMSGDILTIGAVHTLLGCTSKDYALLLLEALASESTDVLLTCTRNIALEGGQFDYVLDDLLSYLHQMTIIQVAKETQAAKSFVDNPALLALSTQISPQDAQLFYEIALKGRQNIYAAPTVVIGFEMLMLRMLAFRLKTLQPKEHVEKIKQDPVSKQQPSPSPPPAWDSILPSLSLTGLALNAAEHVQMRSKELARVYLIAEERNRSIFTSSVVARLTEALSRYFNETISVVLDFEPGELQTPAKSKEMLQKQTHENAQNSIKNDSVVKHLKETFSAEIVENSLVSLGDDL